MRFLSRSEEALIEESNSERVLALYKKLGDMKIKCLKRLNEKMRLNSYLVRLVFKQLFLSRKAVTE